MLTAPAVGGNGEDAPRLNREYLESLPRRYILKAAINKPDLYAVNCGGVEIAVKDYRLKPWIVRIVGWLQIAHEARAYEWLGSRGCIPRYYGRVDRDAIATELIDGGELAKHSSRFSDRRKHLHEIRSNIECFRESGFLHLDSRGLHNVMVRSSGELVFIDLAGSLWVRPGGLLYRLSNGLIRRFYVEVLKKWRKRLSPTRTWVDDRSLLRKSLEYIRKPHHFFARRRKIKERGSKPPSFPPSSR